MLALQFCIVWCFVISTGIAGSAKREITTPELVRGGFAASNGPYGNEASASSLNYQVGNQGNYNNIDPNNGYNDYSNYNGQYQQSVQPQNIPVQEQADGRELSQHVRVPVWSPPTPSEYPYTAPPHSQINAIPQSELIQIPIQQTVQVPYQQITQQQQQAYYTPQQQDQQVQQQFAQQFQDQQHQQQQSNYADQAIQGYANNIPQQYASVPQYNEQPSLNVASHSAGLPFNANNVQTFLGSTSAVNDNSYVNAPSSAGNIAAAYSSGLASPGRVASSISSGLPNVLPSHSGIPSFGGNIGSIASSISSGAPRLIGKPLGRGISSLSGLTSSVTGPYKGVGALHSLDEVLSGGINGFDTSNFGGGFGNSGFDFGGFGKDYFGGFGGFGGFSGFNSNPFASSLNFGGIKGGIGSTSAKFPNLGGLTGSSSIGNAIPLDSKLPIGNSFPTSSIAQNVPYVQTAISSNPNTSGSPNIPANIDAINQPTPTQHTKH